MEQACWRPVSRLARSAEGSALARRRLRQRRLHRSGDRARRTGRGRCGSTRRKGSLPMRAPGLEQKARGFASPMRNRLPFADRSFDAAVMALVISFVPDPFKAVSEMARVVRPGGCVATYMWDIPGGGLPLRPDQRCDAVPGPGATLGPPGSEVSRQESMRALWEQAGLGSSGDARDPHSGRVFRASTTSGTRTACRSGPPARPSPTLSPEKREELKARAAQATAAGAGRAHCLRMRTPTR